MKRLIMFLGCALLGGGALAQGSDKSAQSQPYDSLENFMGENAARYKGQVLFLKNSDEARANNGYPGFGVSPNFDLGTNGRNIFRAVPSKVPLQNVSNYNRMAGHYFRVNEVIERPVKAFTRGGLTHYLEATDLNTNEKCYIAYEAFNPESFKNMVVVGYYDKMRGMCIGNTYIYTGKEPGSRPKAYVGLQDMEGKGRRSDIKSDSEWKCVDVAIEEANDRQVIAVLENPQYGKVYTLVSDLMNTSDRGAKFRTAGDIKSDAEKARLEEQQRAQQEAARLKEATDRFGKENGTLLAKGEVKVGMTKEMCRWAFGDPLNILTVTEGGENVDQWFYTNGRYLYFLEDRLIRQSQATNYKDDRKYFHNEEVK